MALHTKLPGLLHNSPKHDEEEAKSGKSGLVAGLPHQGPVLPPPGLSRKQTFPVPDCPQWQRQQSVNGLHRLRKRTQVWWARPAKELELLDQCSTVGAELGAQGMAGPPVVLPHAPQAMGTMLQVSGPGSAVTSWTTLDKGTPLLCICHLV